MLCPACGTDNRAGRRFCSQCGGALMATCPSCGASNEPTDRFCGECGSPLEAGVPTARAAPQPQAERKLVSVLFADLVGFTALSETRDAEDVREMLTRYFDTARRVIARYGGMVEKFIGDAVMAVWGTPAAKEDDAERAVRAALELIDATAALGEQADLPGLRLRAGVTTGQAAVTLGAEGQGMVAGDVVNTASRLQTASEAGRVLVDDATRRTTEAAIAYEDGGSLTVKGKDDPVRVWRAGRVLAARGGAQRSSGLEAPFVGRDREMRLVKELFHASAEEGKAHLVSVIGIPGIGKSRLAWEFEKYMDGLVEQMLWHRGRCLAYGEGVTYWALAEMVRMRARITEGEDEAAARDKLMKTMEAHVVDSDERAWMEPRLAHLLALEEGSFEREDLFSAWRLFFERLAERSPTVMVFEDLQWADTGLLDFIECMLDWSRSHPLFVLTLSRPEMLDRRADWGAGRRNFTSMFLEPLTDAAMSDLLTGLIPGLPPDVLTRIRERAEGVPLYAVETVRMLLDRGSLRQDENRYVLTGEIETLDVPETLHALIAARLDGLDERERRYLQDASVLGKTFTKERLAAIAGVHPGELDDALAALVRKEMLAVEADARSPERGQYGFSQSLVQQVAYGTLSRRERKARHLAAAVEFEAGGADDDEISEVVASHYVEAYQADPDAEDAEQIRAKARTMLIKAGRRAESLAARPEAQRYYEQAAELTEDTTELAELHERAGQMAWLAARGAEAQAHFEEAIRLFESTGATHPVARVSARLAELMWLHEQRIEEAVERMQASFDVLVGEEPDEDFAILAAQLARLLFFMGRIDEAYKPVEAALEVAERIGAVEVLSQALNTKSLIYGQWGRSQEALGLMTHALRIALDNDIPSAALRAYNNLYSAGFSWGVEVGTELATAGLELARRVGDRGWEEAFLGRLMEEHYRLGEWDEAEALAADLPQPGDPEAKGRRLEYLAFPLVPIYAHSGRFEDAARNLALFADDEMSSDLQARAGYLMTLAELLFVRGDYEGCVAMARSAMGDDESRAELAFAPTAYMWIGAASIELGDFAAARDPVEMLASQGVMREWSAAQASRLRAVIGAAQGESDENVEADFRAAEQGFRELREMLWVAVTRLQHGEWATSAGRREEAASLLDEARALFRRMGATPWLNRLEKVAPGAAEQAS